MNENEARAFQYRQRAEELRRTVPDMADEFCRKTLENVIDQYEKLATVQDKLSRLRDSFSI